LEETELTDVSRTVPAPPPALPSPDPEEAERAARSTLGHITILAIPVETYQKIETEAQARGMRAVELIQRALVEYVERHPPKKAKE
jgi:hypothetical protein